VAKELQVDVEILKSLLQAETGEDEVPETSEIGLQIRLPEKRGLEAEV
jgi:hypothetical protein